MAFASTAYHADSDADDEYERSVLVSPRLAEDSETSPIDDSEAASAVNTPKTSGNTGNDRKSPKSIITEWTADDCSDFLDRLALKQYGETFKENNIVGEALIALKHDELKEMGISSVGHRLTILKTVYDTKVKQGIPIDPDHYVPLSAERDSQDDPITQEDLAQLIRSIQIRDERMMSTEAELRKLADDYRRLRQELLPVFKLAKDRSQPLPYQPTPPTYSGSTLLSEQQHTSDTTGATSPAGSTIGPFSTQQDRSGSSLSRTFSKKLFAGGATPKNHSPTQLPQSIPEGKAYNDSSSLDPSAAAMAASSHLTASMNGGQPSPKNIPSPTSPSSLYANQTLGPRSYSRTDNPSRAGYDNSDDGPSQRPDRSGATSANPSSSGRQDNSPSGAVGSSGSSTRNTAEPGGPSVEIFKSFRVSMEDPCHKVLPAALKKYNIHEDWRLYALYIVYGDQERCLSLEEKPLILFKQLAKEGKKPMFMLRKQAQMVDGQPMTIPPSAPTTGAPSINTGADSGGTGGGAGGGLRSQAPQIGSIQLPGGVL